MQATTIRRRLAEANPAAYLPDLVMSLSNLGNRLSEVWRRDEALGPAEEATTLYRRLAEANPAAHLPNLAMSLWAYAWSSALLRTNQEADVLDQSGSEDEARYDGRWKPNPAGSSRVRHAPQGLLRRRRISLGLVQLAGRQPGPGFRHGRVRCCRERLAM